jgi:hypothetical protein
MTKDELMKYKELQEKFEYDVDRITRTLSRIERYRRDFYTYDKVWLELGYDGKPDEVCTEGSYRYDNYYGSFDADMLTWSDEKLLKFVEELIEKERKEREEYEIQIRQKQEDIERKEYERLKQKFG